MRPRDTETEGSCAGSFTKPASDPQQARSGSATKGYFDIVGYKPLSGERMPRDTSNICVNTYVVLHVARFPRLPLLRLMGQLQRSCVMRARVSPHTTNTFRAILRKAQHSTAQNKFDATLSNIECTVKTATTTCNRRVGTKSLLLSIQGNRPRIR